MNTRRYIVKDVIQKENVIRNWKRSPLGRNNNNSIKCMYGDVLRPPLGRNTTDVTCKTYVKIHVPRKCHIHEEYVYSLPEALKAGGIEEQAMTKQTPQMKPPTHEQRRVAAEE